MAKILVVEDELKIQQIIKAYLEKEGLEVYTAGDGVKGLEMVKEQHPDLVVLDLMLPLLSGEELLSRLRQISEVPVIILSAKSTEDEKIFGLNIGADDYLVKPFSPRELVARVNAHLRRMKSGAISLSAAPSAIRSFNQGKLVINPEKYEIILDGRQVNLTPTEFKILCLLTEVPGRVYSRNNLVEHVQGYNYDGYDRTIDSHIKNLRQKVEPNPDEPTFILTVFGVGYKFGGERDV